MQISESIDIAKSKEAVWSVVTDIENCSDWISNIISVEILDKPNKGFIGTKWKETRMFCGKEASEVMWITDCVDNDYYDTRAESHGAVYISRISVEEKNGLTTLVMSFSGEPQTFIAKILSKLMSRFITKSLKTELKKDLDDIKQYVEKD